MTTEEFSAKLAQAQAGDIDAQAEEAREAERLEAEEREEEERQSMEAQGRKEKKYLNGIGVFSVAPDRKVAFSAGTLLYNTSTQEWSFADNQYSAESEDSDDSMYMLSEFAWGSGNLPMGSPDIPDEDYESKDFYDWGNNAIINGGNKAGLWRTLEVEEWKYLINERPHAKDLWKSVTLQGKGIQLIMLMPDNFNSLDLTEVKKGKISEDDLARLEERGVIFMPIQDENGDEVKYWLKWEVDDDVISPSAIVWPIEYDPEYEEPEELHAVRLVRDL